MLLSEISVLGVVFVALLTGGVIGLFAFIDRKMMMRILRVGLYTLMSFFVVMGYLWAISTLHGWWVQLLWGGILVVATAYWVLRRSGLWLKPLILPLLAAMILVMPIVIGTVLVLLPVHDPLLVVGALAVVVGQVLVAVPEGLKTYVASLRHTQEHYQYLLANGATHLESIMSSVRRAVRASVVPSLRVMTTPLILAPPLLLCGFLMAGATPFHAVVVTFLMWLLSLSASVFITVLTLVFADRLLFDRSGRFLL